jgi:uncharacterized protein YndB with AHSA1/START domain
VSGLAVHTDPARFEVTFERELPADPDAVWAAWTDPHRLAAWWGPAGWQTVVRVLDLRPGGLWHFGMGPENDAPWVWIRAIFTEVVTGSSLSYLEGFSDAEATDLDPEPNAVTVDLVELDAGRTRLVMRIRFASASRLSQITEMGMTEGWREGFDRLEALLTGARR